MREHPDNHIFPVSLAHVFKADGEFDKAVGLYRKAYEIKNDHGDAYWSLANTKSYQFTDDELSRMESLAAGPQTRTSRTVSRSASHSAMPTNAEATTNGLSATTNRAMH